MTESSSAEMSTVKLALAAQEARKQAARDPRTIEPIAIVGSACRFPGADDPEAFWELCAGGVDAISEVPADRWDVDAFYDEDRTAPGKINTRWGGFLDDIRSFDARAFDLSPREAERMDPQQRLVLEIAYEALERAGIAPPAVAGGRVGTYVGSTMHDYADRHLRQPDEIDAYSITGNTHAITANRLSFLLDLRGPSVALDTACSSSLVAVHQAVRGLRSGETDLALAGGVNLIVTPEPTIAMARWGVLAADGRCKPFDHRADGFTRAEGCGFVVLKRLSDAIKAGDRIHAVIRGTAVNQDGRSTALSAPNGSAQQAVVRDALADAGLRASDINCIEAHGTGTELGDPIEVEALASVLGPPSPDAGPVAVTAVKSNVGHLEAAAGMAGLLKLIAMVEHGKIAGTLHQQTRNPLIDLDGSRLEIPSETVDWPVDATRRGGVSAFGFGGTNAHVIVEEAPRIPAPADPGPPYILPFTARDGAGLTTHAAALADALAGHERLHDVAATLATSRSHAAHRAAVVGDTADALQAALATVADGRSGARARVSTATGADPGVAFIFSGQGTQWAGMGRGLLALPLAGESLRASAAALDPISGWSLLDELAQPAEQSRLHQTEFAQPAIFAIQVALAAQWQAWGITPTAVAGHSVGEIAAAHVTGALDLQTAARLVVERGRLMQQATGTGRMASVAASAPVVTPLVDGLDVTLAALNSPSATVLSGAVDSMTAAVTACRDAGLDVTDLGVDYAFHSPLMEPYAASLESLDLRATPTAIPFVSTVSGRQIAGDELDASYWADNVRRPVRFESAVETLHGLACHVFLEIGPHPVLGGAVATTLADQERPPLAVASLRRDRDEPLELLDGLAALFAAGAPIDWAAVMPERSTTVDLPTTPWNRSEHWVDAPRPTAPIPGEEILTGPGVDGRVVRSFMDQASPAWTADHRVVGHVVVPATALAQLLIDAVGDRAVALADVSVEQPLVLGPEPTEVRVVLDDADRPRATLTSLRGDQWLVHAHAMIETTVSEPRPPLDIETIRARCSSSTTPEQLAEIAAARGLEFGPAFRSLVELQVGERESIARLRPTLTSEHALHPAVLDAALHGISPLLDPDATFLPIGVQRLQSFGPATAEIHTHAVVADPDAAVVRADVVVADATGRVLAAIEGLQLARTTAAALRRQLDSGLDDIAVETTSWAAADLDATTPLDAPLLVITGAGERSRELASVLAERHDVVTVGRSPSVTELERHLAERAFRAVVALGALDLPGGLAPDASSQIEPVLTDIVAATAAATHHATELWLVSSGAVAASDAPSHPMAAAVWGWGPTVDLETGSRRTRLVDLDPDAGPADRATALVRSAESAQRRLAWRAGTPWAPEITDRRSLLLPRPEATRVVTDEPGSLDALTVVETARRAPEPHEVEIAVLAAGLNFRDVLLALDQYPERSDVLGDECVGRVTRVGAGVERVAPGDLVMGMASGSFATHVTTSADLVVAVPEALDPVDAASIPITFLTAHHGLIERARLTPGDRVLIHAAAGGVGMAAVQLATAMGAEVFATAGTEAKRDAVRAMGVEHVFDSRSLRFADDVLAATSGAGVDVVLNSLAGDFVDESFRTLADGGRFVEIGRTDIWTDEEARTRRSDAEYHIVFLGEFSLGDTARIAAMFDELVPQFADGVLTPLPVTDFSMASPQAAFRHMAQARHLGKIVLRNDLAPSPIEIAGDATYVISGGRGGLGLAVADALVEAGARHLALLGRRAADPAAADIIAALRADGVEVLDIQVDVADVDALRAAVEGVLPPIRGVIHTAGVNHDAVLAEHTSDGIRATLVPKADGTAALAAATAHHPLDFFVSFSSAAATLGAPGQANYAAANAVLDASSQWLRAESRRTHVSLGWGPWDRLGMTARLDDTDLDRLERRGLRSLDPLEATRAMLAVIAAGADADSQLTVTGRPTRAGGTSTTPEPTSLQSVVIDEWRDLPEARRHGAVERFVVGQASTILGLGPDQQLTTTEPFQSLGLDSLMAVELRNLISAAVGVSQPASLLYDHPTIETLTAHLLTLAASGLDDAAVADPEPPPDDLDTIAAMSEEEAESLLLAELGPTETES